jgi:hypothetical protein
MFKWWQGPLFEEAADGDGDGATLPEVKDTELDQLKARLAQQDTELSTLKQTLQQRPAPQPQPVPQKPPSKAELEKEFWADPLGKLGELAQVVRNNTLAEVQAMQHEPLTDLAKQKARETDPEVFDALEVQVLAKIQDIPKQYHTNTTLWVNALNQVKGENLDKVMEIRGKSGQRAPHLPDGPAPTSPRNLPTTKKTLQPEEAEIARKMKLTPEQYLRGKEFYANQEDMWKGVVTFDSQFDRRTVDARK